MRYLSAYALTSEWDGRGEEREREREREREGERGGGGRRSVVCMKSGGLWRFDAGSR
jgi:hypothetical protein